jgi:ribonucleoside-diphosphate reductase beta chain
MGIFDKRVEFKPFEYPDVSKFRDAINHSYWLVSEWNFISDVQDFHTNLTPAEQNTVKNAMLAISQIEVSVKKFWAKLGERFPKAEIDQVGITFGESEVRHESSYSHLLQVLQLNDDFKKLLEIPCMGGRVEYLSKYINNAPQKTNQEYILTLTLFTIFVENISLFSQFLVIKSFNKHKNVLKDIDNVIQATRAEEILHAQFGFWLINEVKKNTLNGLPKNFTTRL